MHMILKEGLIILHGSFVFLNQLGSIRKINMVHFFMNNTTKINEKCLNEILLDCCALHQESEWLALKLLYMFTGDTFLFLLSCGDCRYSASIQVLAVLELWQTGAPQHKAEGGNDEQRKEQKKWVIPNSSYLNTPSKRYSNKKNPTVTANILVHFDNAILGLSF